MNNLECTQTLCCNPKKRINSDMKIAMRTMSEVVKGSPSKKEMVNAFFDILSDEMPDFTSNFTDKQIHASHVVDGNYDRFKFCFSDEGFIEFVLYQKGGMS